MITALVVTRHPALVFFLIEKGYISADSEVVEHASAETVANKHVWGVLPHSLSCLCKSFTEVPLALPAELRGKELSVEDMHQYASEPVTYVVSTVKDQAVTLENYFNWGQNSFTPTIDWQAEAIREGK